MVLGLIGTLMIPNGILRASPGKELQGGTLAENCIQGESIIDIRQTASMKTEVQLALQQAGPPSPGLTPLGDRVFPNDEAPTEEGNTTQEDGEENEEPVEIVSEPPQDKNKVVVIPAEVREATQQAGESESTPVSSEVYGPSKGRKVSGKGVGSQKETAQEAAGL